MNARKSKAVVTLSGGADSATILYLAMKQCEEVHAISINYGQRHVKELECAKNLCKLNNIKHMIVPFDLTIFGGSPLTDKNIEVPAQCAQNQSVTVVPYRNTFIIMIAAAYCKANKLNTIYAGPTYEDLANYEDCRPVYFEALQQLVLVAGTIHDLEIRTPFITTCKQQIIQIGQMLQVPYGSTWTCYKGEDAPCTICDACRERMASFRVNGIRDPLVSEDKWAEYMKEFEKENINKER
jgi:7-cyano-7-deazaguanine synthase